MKKIRVLIIVIFIGFYGFSQKIVLPDFISDSLDSYIKKGMKEWQIPGMSVAIVKDNKIIFLKGYGVLENGKTGFVDENTVFMIGSNTKAFTATALTMLEEEKIISLQDKVYKWIPYFKLQDSLASNEISIEDLLCHRIGFETFQGDFTYWTSNLNRKQVIQKMSAISPLYPFRTKWGYCNAAFLTAGEIIPMATGKSWEETIQEKILNPLGMNRTVMLSSDLSKVNNVASPHTLVHGKLVNLPFPMIDNLAPAGSMSSSARDMCQWLIAQLDSGRLNNNRVISPQSIFKTRNPRSILKLDQRFGVSSHFYLYGLGFLISDRYGKVVVSHTGGVDGFVSSVLLVPEEKLGVVVLTNTDQNTFFQSLTNEIRDAFLGLPFQDFSKLSLEQFLNEEADAAKWHDSLKNIISKSIRPDQELKSFTGVYSNKVYGDIEVKIENFSLCIYFSNHPGLIGKLEHISNNSFLCTYSNPTMGIKEIPFKVENGRVTGLTLRVADFVEFLPYEFEKK